VFDAVSFGYMNIGYTIFVPSFHMYQLNKQTTPMYPPSGNSTVKVVEEVLPVGFPVLYHQ